MATISNTRLAISTEPLNNRATITVTCDVEFTDVEVSAMNLLGLRYTLQCQIFDKDLWERKPVAVLDEWTFPKMTESKVSKNEHVVFNTDRPMTDLHTHFLSNDNLQERQRCGMKKLVRSKRSVGLTTSPSTLSHECRGESTTGDENVRFTSTHVIIAARSADSGAA